MRANDLEGVDGKIDQLEKAAAPVADAADGDDAPADAAPGRKALRFVGMRHRIVKLRGGAAEKLSAAVKRVDPRTNAIDFGRSARKLKRAIENERDNPQLAAATSDATRVLVKEVGEADQEASNGGVDWAAHRKAADAACKTLSAARKTTLKGNRRVLSDNKPVKAALERATAELEAAHEALADPDAAAFAGSLAKIRYDFLADPGTADETIKALATLSRDIAAGVAATRDTLGDARLLEEQLSLRLETAIGDPAILARISGLIERAALLRAGARGADALVLLGQARDLFKTLPPAASPGDLDWAALQHRADAARDSAATLAQDCDEVEQPALRKHLPTPSQIEAVLLKIQYGAGLQDGSLDFAREVERELREIEVGLDRVEALLGEPDDVKAERGALARQFEAKTDRIETGLADLLAGLGLDPAFQTEIAVKLEALQSRWDGGLSAPPVGRRRRGRRPC